MGIPEAKLFVILLAAGVGRRLGQDEPAPKVLLDFDGTTLIERHLAMLAEAGVAGITLVTGFMADTLEAEVRAAAPGVPVTFVRNPRFREGSVVSFAVGAQALLADAGDDALVMLMDGDVLYDSRMLDRLIAAEGENILLVDRELEPGDEPVKICDWHRGLKGRRRESFRRPSTATACHPCAAATPAS